jgi:DNA repair exonuclease SbcCD ATPase subunit
MIFQKLLIENFGTIGRVELPLHNQGLTLILGRNEDAPKACSNGSGKSLLLDAPVWCVWGETVRGLQHDAVINDRVGKDCKVTLWFQEEGVDYRITRYRNQTEDVNYKPNDLVLFANDVDVSGVSVQTTQAMIDEILGVDFVTFCAMMPGAGVKVSELTDLKIKELLERLLQTEVLGKAQKHANEELKEVTKDLAVLEAQLKSSSERIELCKQQAFSYQQSFDSFEDRQIERCDALLAKVHKAQAELQGLDEVVTRGKLAEEERAHFHACRALNDKKIRDLWAEETRLRTTASQEQAEIRETISAEQAVIRTLVERLQKLSSLDSHCPTCEQVVAPEYQGVLRADLHAKQNELQGIVAGLTQTNVQIKELMERNIRAIQPLINGVKAQVIELDKEISHAEGLMDAASKASQRKTLLSDGISQVQLELQQVKEEPNPFAELVQQAKEQQTLLAAEEAEKAAQAEELTHKAKLLQFWATGFAPSGIRSFMLEHVTPVLNASAKKYADLLTGGEMSVVFHTRETLKNGKTKEKFNVSVSQKNGGSSYVSNSTGERSRANLVIALAIGDLATMRSNKRIPFRFLDEPFESVDESGTDAIVSLLSQESSAYDTVFVITHQDHFKQLFPSKITVVKKNGFTELESENHQ